MKDLLFQEKKSKSIYFVAFFLVCALFFATTESFPRHFRLHENILQFLNNVVGFKFFSRRFWFFFSDLCILSALLIGFRKIRASRIEQREQPKQTGQVEQIKKGSFFKAEGAFFLYALSFLIFLSLFFSPFALTYFQLFMACNFLITAVYYSLIVNLKEKIYQIMPILLFGIFLLAIFQISVGLYQYFTQHSVGLKCLYEPQFSPGNFNVATLTVRSGHLWLFDTWFKEPGIAKTIVRAVGSFPHANNFGAFLFFSLLASFYFLFFSKNHLVKKGIVFFMFFQVFTLFLSFSRAAIFALALSFSFFLLYTLWKGSFLEKKAVKKGALLLFLAASLSLGLLFQQYEQRGGVVSYNKGVAGSDNRRLYYNDVSFQIMKKHPLLGIGFFNYKKQHPHFISSEIRDKYIDKSIGGVVHNIYLLIASEEGLLSLGCFLLFIGFLFYRFFTLPFLLERTLFFSFFLGVLFIGLCDFPYMYMPQGRLFFFLIPACLSAINFASQKETKKTLVLG